MALFGSGIGPSNMGAMGRAANMVTNKFAGQNQNQDQPQVQPFGNMGNNYRTMMGMGRMGMSGPAVPSGVNMSSDTQPMPGGIGPSNFQELLRRYLTMGSGNTSQPMNSGLMGQAGMPQGLGVNSLYNGG